MVKLKNKIITVYSLPPDEKKKISVSSILITLIIVLMLIITTFSIIKETIPYIHATKIENIAGKKTFITACNTKDYIIIGIDKSYSLSLTDGNCQTHYYEGTINIKDNKITFNENISGIIDNNFNIIIKNNLFESDENE